MELRGGWMATLVSAIASVAFGAAAMTLQPPGWYSSIDDGVAAAKKSGKAVLVATAWSNEQ